MGILVLVIALAIEISFAAFCILTKSNQQKVKCIIRITTLIAFVLSALLSIIDWSVRYYPLAALLLLLVITSAVTVIRNREEEGRFKAGRVVWKAIGMSPLLILVTFPAILFPQHQATKPTGQYQVGTVLYTYTDASRVETYTDTGETRELNVELWYPKNADGSYPFVVFSHGGNGVKTSNETLFNELASHGYVVASIDHTYHSLFTTDTDGHTVMIDQGYMQELVDEDPESSRQESYAYYQKWMKIRTDDIKFVIDTILAEALNSDADEVYRLVDAKRIGVMGHSLGGSAALGIGRMRDDVSAVLALDSPFLCDVTGVKDGEFVFTDEQYPVPLLNVYSDDVWNDLDQWKQYAQNLALLSKPPADVFNVHIRGSGHFSLTDLSMTSPLITDMFNTQKSTNNPEYTLQLINKISLKFFDTYIKGEGEFTPAPEY